MASGHVDESKPLRPLTPHAWDVLGRLARKPIPSYQINAGVHGRFRRENLVVEDYERGELKTFITAAGRAKLAERP